jgi:hypothetical protein
VATFHLINTILTAAKPFSPSFAPSKEGEAYLVNQSLCIPQQLRRVVAAGCRLGVFEWGTDLTQQTTHVLK